MRRILLGLTGSVASVLYIKLIEELQKHGIVDVIITEKAKPFINMSSLCDVLEKRYGFLYTEESEWTWRRNGNLVNKWEKDDPVLHILLREQSSALVIAPCSANTMAKIANGICDNLLTSVARAWDRNRPFILAPAMNTHMWNHPVTTEHMVKMIDWGYTIVKPQTKMLACKAYGQGALANIGDISQIVADELQWQFPFPTSSYMSGGACKGIPLPPHPGAFEAKRKNSTHTGVDLYVDEGQVVIPVENGVIVAIEPFTGPKDNSPWWLDTDCVLVEGASGVICYGEIEASMTMHVGKNVKKGNTCLGFVKRVIPPTSKQHPELEGWKPNMLHMELYPHGRYKPSDGYGNSVSYLQDPTPYLLNAKNAPTRTFK